MLISIGTYAAKYNCNYSVNSKDINMINIKNEYEVNKFDWPVYIHYYMQKESTQYKKLSFGPVLIPKKCDHRYTIVRFLDNENREHKINIIYYKILKPFKEIKDFYLPQCKDLINLIKSCSITQDELVLLIHGLFSPQMNNIIDCFQRYILKNKKIENIKIIVQQHSYAPYMYWGIYGKHKYYILSIINENNFRKIKNAIYGYIINNKLTKKYLYFFDKNKHILFQHVGVDYNKIKPTKNREQVVKIIYSLINKDYSKTRKMLFENAIRKIKRCKKIVIMYMPITLLHGGSSRGITYIGKIAKRLSINNYCIVIAGDILDNSLATSFLKHDNIALLGKLKREDFIFLLRNSDLFLIPATMRLYFGGITVTAIEAFALNIPVASPTLVHYPEEKELNYVGMLLPWLNDNTVNEFVNKVTEALEETRLFNPRVYSFKHYHISLMVRRIIDLINKNQVF